MDSLYRDAHNVALLFELALTVGTVFGLAAIGLIITGYELATKKKVR